MICRLTRKNSVADHSDAWFIEELITDIIVVRILEQQCISIVYIYLNSYCSRSEGALKLNGAVMIK